jgi:hypothetical protein
LVLLLAAPFAERHLRRLGLRGVSTIIQVSSLIRVCPGRVAARLSLAPKALQ